MRKCVVFFVLYFVCFHQVCGQLTGEKVIMVTQPGCYAEPGVTYRLANDIRSSRSAIFLGKDVTLDLNGYTIYYADGGYQSLFNSGFEYGLDGWDVSQAPGSKVLNTRDARVFVGDRLMSLEKGDEIVSSYVFLPEDNRSYYAMCAVAGRYYEDLNSDMSNEMRVSLFVEDEFGRDVRCLIQYADTMALSVPVLNKSPRLGGGFVMAHLNNLPAGKYRVRVRAETDCLLDEIDIRPAFDVGIGIVGETKSYGHYDHLFDGKYGAFFDYASNMDDSRSVSHVPYVRGEGTVIIRNGRIHNAAMGVLSFGVQSTAADVGLIVEGVEFESSGISAVAVDALYADIRNCRFDIINPFVINRHGHQFKAVNLRGEQPSRVSYCEFYGGQGCLEVRGSKSEIHHNLFVNRQTVTNHYSLSASGDSTKVYGNRFEPEIGSGVGIYRRKGIEVYDNFFRITASPPSCEYHLDYSTNGIRISDYGAPVGAANGAMDNKIYGNTFEIIGKSYPEYPDYVPLATAVFYSASAGGNEVFDNDIVVMEEDSSANTLTYAFYVGNANEGRLYDNRIVANTTPIWVATVYDGASNIAFSRNSVTKAEGTTTDFAPIRLGYKHGDRPAIDIAFRSTVVEGIPFSVAREGEAVTHFSVSWTLDLSLFSMNPVDLDGLQVEVFDVNGESVFSQKATSDGGLQVELMAYRVKDDVVEVFSPFTVRVGQQEKIVDLESNTKLVFEIN